MRSTIRLGITCFVLLSVILAAAPGQSQKKKPAPKSSKPISYTKDIVPVMKTYCLPCHTEDAMNPSRLYLDTYEGLTAGGKHGPAIVTGKPDSSLLVRKISEAPPFGDPMPMKRKAPFPADTLGLLRSWILQGAKNN